MKLPVKVAVCLGGVAVAASSWVVTGPASSADAAPTDPLGCQFSTADQPLTVALCDTFDAPAGDPTKRSGDLEPELWGVSRTNTHVNLGQGEYNAWSPAQLEGCGNAAITVLPPDDVRICNGRVVEAVSDNGGQSTLAMYPKQPFDIAGGRTGTVVFDVSADSESIHSAWPEFWWSDQPVPAVHGHLAAQSPFGRNSFGFSVAQQCPGGQTGIDKMMVTRNYVYEEIPFTMTDCIDKGSVSGALNHFEVRINQSRVEVWAGDPGSSAVRRIAVAENANLTMTRGLVWLEDVHYNGCKDGLTQCNHTFAWDNLGFDGPTPYRDLSFDARDSNTALGDGRVQLGYPGTSTVTVDGVYRKQTPTGALVTFNWFPYEPTVPSLRINGGPWHDTPWPFDPETFVWRTIGVSIPVSEVHDGANTIEFRTTTDMAIANVNIILIAAAPVTSTQASPCIATGTVNPPTSSATRRTSLVPARLYDSRRGRSTVDCVGAGTGTRPQGWVTEVPIAGRGGVPADAAAAVVNVTVTGPSADGFVTVWPCGAAMPDASTVNYARGQTISNAAIAKLGSGGKICVYSYTGSDLVIDVTGFEPAASTFGSLTPARLLDTRSGRATIDGAFRGIGPRTAAAVTELQIAGRGGVPTNARAAALNVTVTGPVGDGFVTVWPCGSNAPDVSSVNYERGQTVSTAVVMSLSATGRVCLSTFTATDLVVDVTGFEPAGSSFGVVSPARLLDSRPGRRTIDAVAAGIGVRNARSVTELQVAGRGNVPSNASAAVLNVTVTNPSGDGYVTVWPCGTTMPDASTVNYALGQTISNAVIAKMGAGGKVCLYTYTGTDLVVDVNGYDPAAT